MNDLSLFFCINQTFTGTDTTTASTDWIAVGALQCLGDNTDPPGADFHVTTSFAGAGTVSFQLVSCTGDSSGTFSAVLDESRAYATSELVAVSTTNPAGCIVSLRMSPQIALPAQSGLRLRARYTGAVSAGAGTAHLVPIPASQRPKKAYPGT